MPRYCSICAHAKTADITKALTAGDSIRTVASRFGVTPAAAGRHLRGCLHTERRAKKSGSVEKEAAPVGLSRFESLDPPTLVAATARLVDEALDLLEHAKRADDRELRSSRYGRPAMGSRC